MTFTVKIPKSHRLLLSLSRQYLCKGERLIIHYYPTCLGWVADHSYSHIMNTQATYQEPHIHAKRCFRRENRVCISVAAICLSFHTQNAWMADRDEQISYKCRHRPMFLQSRSFSSQKTSYKSKPHLDKNESNSKCCGKIDFFRS